MVHQMAIIELHPSLHGGLPKHGMGTATIEAKLAQQLCVCVCVCVSASGYEGGYCKVRNTNR
jgi:hypothetical protein